METKGLKKKRTRQEFKEDQGIIKLKSMERKYTKYLIKYDLRSVIPDILKKNPSDNEDEKTLRHRISILYYLCCKHIKNNKRFQIKEENKNILETMYIEGCREILKRYTDTTPEDSEPDEDIDDDIKNQAIMPIEEPIPVIEGGPRDNVPEVIPNQPIIPKKIKLNEYSLEKIMEYAQKIKTLLI